jgi:hypothetical protein
VRRERPCRTRCRGRRRAPRPPAQPPSTTTTQAVTGGAGAPRPRSSAPRPGRSRRRRNSAPRSRREAGDSRPLRRPRVPATATTHVPRAKSPLLHDHRTQVRTGYISGAARLPCQAERSEQPT